MRLQSEDSESEFLIAINYSGLTNLSVGPFYITKGVVTNMIEIN